MIASHTEQMDPRETDAIVQRLVINPHDEEALAYAHQWGVADPKGYALLLEKVGSTTQDPAYASHWLSEAANIWSVTVGDAHRAARVLMLAIEKDPTHEVAAERLAQLYRDKGEHRALAALLERRAKALAPLATQNEQMRAHLAGVYEELGRLWSEPPLSQPRKALEQFRRAIELDPRSIYAIYAVRELYKQANQITDALPLFDMEQGLVDDPERKAALYRDEAHVRQGVGDLAGATQVLRNARIYQPDDPFLMQELASIIMERVKSGEPVSRHEREEAALMLVVMAEMYGGEHGLTYSLAALDVDPGHDRAMQLADYYGKSLDRTAELPNRWSAYLAANPDGALASEARTELALGGTPLRSEMTNPELTASPAARAALAPVRSSPGAAARSSPPPARSSPAASSPRPDTQEPAGEPELSGPEQLTKLLHNAADAASRGNKATAFAKYKEALAIDPSHAEALPWVKDHLRQKRLYGELRDVLVSASRATPSIDDKKQLLREVAALCEQQLRDVEGAIQALKQLTSVDRNDLSVSESLRRLLEKSNRWDELASVLEEQAMSAPDLEGKLALEKKLAQLHETKRKDPQSAAEAWARIVSMTPDDDQAVWTAVKLFEKANRLERAAQTISESAASIEDKIARAALFVRLGELREKLGDLRAAGDAFTEAASLNDDFKTWEAAERSYVKAEQWADAARAVDARAELVGEPKSRATLLFKAVSLYTRAGEEHNALTRLEEAVEQDPTHDEYARVLEQRYIEADRFTDLAAMLLARADALSIHDRPKRIGLRKKAAKLQRHQLDNREAARESFFKILEDGDDEEALLWLVNDAEAREDYHEATSLLRRLAGVTKTPNEKLAIVVREARLLAEQLDDIDGAIARYESILAELDAQNHTALMALADLEERRGNLGATAAMLERLLAQSEEEEARGNMARRLADLYEGPLDDIRAAIKVLEVIVALDDSDYDANARLCTLTEQAEDYPRTVELLRKQIENEMDEAKVSSQSCKLASILYAKLDKGDEALEALEDPADRGDRPCQQMYCELGDKLGWQGLVATKLIAWNESRSPSPDRNTALRGAFDRLVAIERDGEAAQVALELIRTRSADIDLAQKLEEIGVRSKDLDALQAAHGVLARDLSDAARTEELVRQAEVLVTAGVDPLEAMHHAEVSFGQAPPSDVEPWLQRLAVLTSNPNHVIDLYGRQVSRTKAPADRLGALARAAQVASEQGAPERAREFFALALVGNLQEDVLTTLEQAANKADGTDRTDLRQALAEAMSSGGQGARDGGRTRAALLRRAATIAHEDLHDKERAFGWLGDALIAHVDATSLDAVEELGRAADDETRAEAVFTRALEEVFDGPLVRQLLVRRANLRKNRLGNKAGAAEDLKKLRDLSPHDQAVLDDLMQLLTDLGDYPSMIQVLEDQILRGRDLSVRAELARKVAVLWEEQMANPREATDAWRRVLRMKPGDIQAQAGLERAKTNLLKPPDQPHGSDELLISTSPSEAISAEPSGCGPPSGPVSDPPGAPTTPRDLIATPPTQPPAARSTRGSSSTRPSPTEPSSVGMRSAEPALSAGEEPPTPLPGSEGPERLPEHISDSEELRVGRPPLEALTDQSVTRIHDWTATTRRIAFSELQAAARDKEQAARDKATNPELTSDEEIPIDEIPIGIEEFAKPREPGETPAATGLSDDSSWGDEAADERTARQRGAPLTQAFVPVTNAEFTPDEPAAWMDPLDEDTKPKMDNPLRSTLGGWSDPAPSAPLDRAPSAPPSPLPPPPPPPPSSKRGK